MIWLSCCVSTDIHRREKLRHKGFLYRESFNLYMKHSAFSYSSILSCFAPLVREVHRNSKTSLNHRANHSSWRTWYSTIKMKGWALSAWVLCLGKNPELSRQEMKKTRDLRTQVICFNELNFITQLPWRGETSHCRGLWVGSEGYWLDWCRCSGKQEVTQLYTLILSSTNICFLKTE